MISRSTQILRIGMGLGVGITLVSCGSLSTNSTLPIPPGLELEADQATPQPPVSVATPLTLTATLQSQLNLEGNELVLLVQNQGADLMAQLPKAEVVRWMSPSLSLPGIEGIDLTLTIDNYRETATARLRPDQPAVFTFSEIPAGSAELSATAFSGAATLAQGQLSLDTGTGDSNGDSPESNLTALVFMDVDVPFLQSIQVLGESELDIEKGTVRQPLPTDTSLLLSGQNLEQVSQVLLIVKGSGQKISATIVEQSSDQLIIQVPATLALKTTVVTLADAEGNGIGHLDVTWLPPQAASDLPQPPELTWLVGLVPILDTLSSSDDGLEEPVAAVADAKGTLYIADQAQHQILRLSPTGKLEVWAGTGIAGFEDGQLEEAQFNQPASLALDPDGNLVVSDQGNHSIRLISPQGQVSTLAGTGKAGFKDGPRLEAQFRDPSGLAIRADGTIYIADTGNHRIRQLSVAGTVVTLAGSGRGGSRDGIGLLAQFDTPTDVTLDDKNRVWVADQGNHSIRQITPTGQVTTLVGHQAGFQDGELDQAQLNQPTALSMDTTGTLWIADQLNHRIRQLTPDNQLITFAGGNQAGMTNGPIEQATLNRPIDLWLNPDGSLVVLEHQSRSLRQIAQGLIPNSIGLTPEAQ